MESEWRQPGEMWVGKEYDGKKSCWFCRDRPRPRDARVWLHRQGQLSVMRRPSCVECAVENVRVNSPGTSKQPAPKGSGRPIYKMVLEDIKDRVREGTIEYGEPLMANNGRDALCDAYQEAIDLVMYLRQLIEEENV